MGVFVRRRGVKHRMFVFEGVTGEMVFQVHGAEAAGWRGWGISQPGMALHSPLVWGF